MYYIDTMLMVSKPPAQTLRDIRPDLRARLREAAAEQEHMKSIMDTLQQTVTLLTKMLEQEEARFAADTESENPKTPDEALPDFILGKLRHSPMSKEDLRWHAERAGYVVDGRSIHLTLVNLARADKVKEDGLVFRLNE